MRRRDALAPPFWGGAREGWADDGGVEFSVVIPARDEERWLPRCLEAWREASRAVDGEVEVIVVLNRCRDRTEEIARAGGARVAREDEPNLSRIRNAGAAVARGEVLVTCDADSVPHPRSLEIIVRKLKGGRLVGGGTLTLPERWSPGIVASM